MKKRLSILLIALLVIMSVSSNITNAQTKKFNIIDTARNFMEIAMQSPSDYGIEDYELDNLQLSEEVIPYKYNGGKLEEVSNIKYYFICNDGQPIATLVVNGEDKDYIPSVTFETDTAKKLEKFLSKSETFTLICDEYGLNIENSNKDIKKFEKLTKIEISNVKSGNLSISSIPSGYGLNIPIKGQGDQQLCWAACIASVVQYKTGVFHTALDVANTTGSSYDAGKDALSISTILSHVYSVPNTLVGGYYPSISTIYNLLLANRVTIAMLYANMWDSDPLNDKGHAVVIQGYRAGTQGAVLSIMDPNNSNYVLISPGTTPNGYSTWCLSYGTLSFYWTNSVTTN